MMVATAMPDVVVYIVDDDDAVRDALEILFSSVSLPVRAFASAGSFLDAYDDGTPGCLLLDVRMPGMSGLELQDRLNRRGVTLPVVILTGHADVPMALRAIRAGAFDFVQKPFGNDALLDVVNRALATDAERRLHDAARREVRSCLSSLTERERQVMDEVVAGRTNKEIAYRLGVAERTVEVHRSRVMEKMRARTLADLVRKALLLSHGSADAPAGGDPGASPS